MANLKVNMSMTKNEMPEQEISMKLLLDMMQRPR